MLSELKLRGITTIAPLRECSLKDTSYGPFPLRHSCPIRFHLFFFSPTKISFVKQAKPEREGERTYLQRLGSGPASFDPVVEFYARPDTDSSSQTRTMMHRRFSVTPTPLIRRRSRRRRRRRRAARIRDAGGVELVADDEDERRGVVVVSTAMMLRRTVHAVHTRRAASPKAGGVQSDIAATGLAGVQIGADPGHGGVQGGGEERRAQR